MKRTAWRWLTAAAAVLLAMGLYNLFYVRIWLGSEATSVLYGAKEATLYSIDPGILVPNGAKREFTAVPFGIVGKVKLTGEPLAMAKEAFADAVAYDNDTGMFCFNPRHALRIAADGHTYDFLLCYECEQIAVYKDGRELSGSRATGSPKILNDLLTANNIPLPKSF